MVAVKERKMAKKMQRQLIDGLLFAPKLYGTQIRLNPAYDAGHCFTVTKCDKCGEWYEADKEHKCREQNSYPDTEGKE